MFNDIQKRSQVQEYICLEIHKHQMELRVKNQLHQFSKIRNQNHHHFKSNKIMIKFIQKINKFYSEIKFI